MGTGETAFELGPALVAQRKIVEAEPKVFVVGIDLFALEFDVVVAHCLWQLLETLAKFREACSKGSGLDVAKPLEPDGGRERFDQQRDQFLQHPPVTGGEVKQDVCVCVCRHEYEFALLIRCRRPPYERQTTLRRPAEYNARDTLL